MKNKNYFKAIAMFAISLIFVCINLNANAQIKKAVDNTAGEATYNAKELVKKAIKEGKVEILDCKMKKETDNDGVGVITLTGTALFAPAKFKKKQLKDTPGFGLKAYLYDANGLKLTDGIPIGDYGENDKIENVKYKEPFPFKMKVGVGGYIKQETFDKADYCVIRGWNTVKQVSSKDSN